MLKSSLPVVLVLLVLVSCRTTTPDAKAEPIELRVMTFNVWSAENTHSGQAKLREILGAADADIVGLQEMGNSQGQAIADALGYHYHQQSGGGIQVLSKYPIVDNSPANRGVQIQIAPG
ncbi:MAG: endonuclease/exonuclease/phosphatase family protein, partial [Rhodospirillales bacterium]|nr:endonuclease/exonuclease/phosphatase family protein [Rhodospirillales bacterium]